MLLGHKTTEAWRLVRLGVASPATPEVVVEGDQGSVSWATNSSDLYWCDGKGLRRMPKVGGSPVEMLTAPYCNVYAADDSIVLYGHDGALHTMEASGGEPIRLVEADVHAAVMDEADVFFAEMGGKVRGVSRSGGSPQLLTDDGSGVAENGSYLYFRRVDDSGEFYEVEYNIWRLPKSGGEAKGFFMGHRAYALDFGSTHAYVATSNALYRTAL